MSEAELGDDEAKTHVSLGAVIKAVVAAVRLNDGVHHAPPPAAAAADDFSTLLLQRSTSTSKAIAGDAPPPAPVLPRKPSVSYSTAPEGDAAGGDGADGGVPFGAVVHFTNHFAEPSLASPWKVNAPAAATGTGFAIAAGRILTNNHVVEHCTSLRASRHGVPGNYEARVLCASAVCDLALVTVDDGAFWESMPTTSFQDAVPALDDTVVAVG